MKLLFAVVFACLANAFGQTLPCAPKNFKAHTFDVIEFTQSISYHDMGNGLSLYENIKDNSKRLFDFNSGIVYIQRSNGSCYYTADNDGQLAGDPQALSQNIKQKWTTMGDDMLSRTGLELTSGHVILRNVLDGNCDSVFISFTINGRLQVAESFLYHEELTDDDAAKVVNALGTFQASDCQQFNLD